MTDLASSVVTFYEGSPAEHKSNPVARIAAEPVSLAQSLSMTYRDRSLQDRG